MLEVQAGAGRPCQGGSDLGLAVESSAALVFTEMWSLASTGLTVLAIGKPSSRNALSSGLCGRLLAAPTIRSPARRVKHARSPLLIHVCI